MGDTCKLCQDSECTIFFFGNSRCLATTVGNMSGSPRVAPTHRRAINGFCTCMENHCMDIEGSVCRPEADGWTANVQTNQCECGLGYCLIPYADQVIESASKYHCMKMTKTMTRNATDGMCGCAEGSPKIESSDPAEAMPEKLPACKVYPSTPVKKVYKQGPMYPEFTCMAEP